VECFAAVGGRGCRSDQTQCKRPRTISTRTVFRASRVRALQNAGFGDVLRGLQTAVEIFCATCVVLVDYVTYSQAWLCIINVVASSGKVSSGRVHGVLVCTRSWYVALHCQLDLASLVSPSNRHLLGPTQPGIQYPSSSSFDLHTDIFALASATLFRSKAAKCTDCRASTALFVCSNHSVNSISWMTIIYTSYSHDRCCNIFVARHADVIFTYSSDQNVEQFFLVHDRSDCAQRACWEPSLSSVEQQPTYLGRSF